MTHLHDDASTTAATKSAASAAENDHGRDQDDEPDNDDHDILRGSEWLTDAGRPGRHVCAVCRSAVLAVLSGARTGGNRRTGR